MNPSIIHTKTVILGAGISGISCAINLLKHNYNDFLVFEALERIGGRMCTQTNDQGYLEIGAQWIHGQEGNPLFELAREHGLIREGFENVVETKIQPSNIELAFKELNLNTLLQDIDVETTNERVLFATQNGKNITSKFAQSVYDSITEMIANAEQLNLDKSLPDSRVGDYLVDKFQEIISKTANLELKRILNGLFLMRSKRENIRSGCSNIFDLSLKEFSNYKEFKGHSYVELKKGYTPIIKAFIAKYEQEYLSRVSLNHYMKRIYLCTKQTNQAYKRECFHCKYTNDSNKAVVKICNATNPADQRDTIVVCDNVLCTMSLGYLKENINQIIEPLSLITDERRLSVSRLGFGTINKIFLFYDKPFWSPSLKLVNMIWVPENSDYQIEKLIYRNSNKKIWYEDICKFEVVDSYPNALSGWIAGSEDFERLDDKAIATECTRLLRKFLANDKIPEPVSILRTKWNMNRFSRGSYSHMPLGSQVIDHDNLAEPIPSKEKPIVMFAGEATHQDLFSTTHGAYFTGLRESERILKSTNAYSNL